MGVCGVKRGCPWLKKTPPLVVCAPSVRWGGVEIGGGGVKRGGDFWRFFDVSTQIGCVVGLLEEAFVNGLGLLGFALDVGLAS